MNPRKWIPFLLLELVALLHVMRIVLGVDIVIGGNVVPMFVSVVAILIFGVGGWLALADARQTPAAP
jgi:protein-S-isoprenylcysteine O-methyltransferase Ste14